MAAIAPVCVQLLALPSLSGKVVCYSSRASAFKPMEDNPCSRATVTAAGTIK